MVRKPPIDLRRLKPVQILLLLILLGGIAIWQRYFGPEPTVGEQAILDAYQAQLSDQTVEAEATVVKLLPDDLIEPRHQKMLLELSSGHSLLLAHNIDLAQRVPARPGDRLRFRGQYVYTPKGGTIHWTHRDPSRRHEEGWIQYQGHRYQ